MMIIKPIVPPCVDLRTLAGITSHCSAVIANTNGPQHIAQALSVPTLTIYGPNNPKTWESGNGNRIYLRDENLDCIGCNKNECKKDLLCMQNITPGFAEKRFVELMETSGTTLVEGKIYA